MNNEILLQTQHDQLISRKMLRGSAILLIATGLMAGCAKSGSAEGPQGDGGTTVTTVVLRDGTHCAVMDGVKDKALSCDWDGTRSAATGVDPQGDSGTSITEILLGDGTLCAVMDSAQSKALSCNWK